MFEARQFERSLIITQCFRCQQWGHRQSACAKQVKCGFCAGQHQTRECKKERPSCANCGKGHTAWHKSECIVFGTYIQRIQEKRIELLTQSYSIRTAGGSQSGTQQYQPFEFPAMAANEHSRKRPRAISPTQVSRRAGRPTHIEQAGKDTAQQKLNILLAAATQESERSDSEMTPVISDE